MKILTLLGTRPEIIRLSRIIEKLDRLADAHVLVHTGQNYDPNLSEVFFSELGVRRPDHFLEVRATTFGEQIGQIIARSERILLDEKPDRLLLLGDTNSALSALVAKRLGIPVYHMEAGNRCFDDRVPEEVNRRVIDHSSDVLMPYTERSRANLLREGIPSNRIYVTGNPISEVIDHHADQIAASETLVRLGLKAKGYFLVTMHRAENVDVKDRLDNLVEALKQLHLKYNLPVICSTHPHTRARLQGNTASASLEGIQFHEPFGLFDFIALEQNAFCVVSDSGTVQEECCIFQVANVTIRDVTERPETLECGSNMLAGADPDDVLRCVRTVLDSQSHWTVPPEYLVKNVSETVAKMLLGYSVSESSRLSNG